MSSPIYVPLDLKTLGIVVSTLLVAIGGLLRLMLYLFQKGLDERAENTASALKKVEEHIGDALNAHRALIEQRMAGFEDRQRREQDRVSLLEAEHKALHQTLAMRFVQREDFIRFASSIDNKIDRLGELFTRYTMKGHD